ncbi:hypothetical protein [Methylomonas koyamae]
MYCRETRTGVFIVAEPWDSVLLERVLE